MAAFEYVFSASQSIRLVRLTDTLGTTAVAILERFDENGVSLGQSKVEPTRAHMDAFANNAASLPGSTFEEKFLSGLAAVGLIPAGGTVQPVP